MADDLHLRLDCRDCPGCGGTHVKLHFLPAGDGVYQAVCPATNHVFHLDTRQTPEVWARLKRAAGL